MKVPPPHGPVVLWSCGLGPAVSVGAVVVVLVGSWSCCGRGRGHRRADSV